MVLGTRQRPAGAVLVGGFLPPTVPSSWWAAGWRAVRSVPGPRRWVLWVLASPARMTVLLWVVGLILAGNARMALAAPLDIIGPPPHGGPKTLFETYGLFNYDLHLSPSARAKGGLGLEEAMWRIVWVLDMLLMLVILGIIYGALSLLEWFLSLTIYHDAAPQLDKATQVIATNVFWPLIACTAAIGLFQAYVKWRGDNDSPVKSFTWVLAAVLIGIGWSSGPSFFMDPVDQARQSIGHSVVTGASQFVTAKKDNPIGFTEPPVGNATQEAGTRTLISGLWTTYGVQPWCWANFGPIKETCREAGMPYLARKNTIPAEEPARSEALKAGNPELWNGNGEKDGWQKELAANGNPEVFREHTDWVRGEDFNRTWVLLLMLVLALPIGVMIGLMVFHGFKAVAGVLVLVVVGVVFLTFWCIDGEPRRWGTKYLAYVIGLQLQALFLTVTVAAIMVASTILAGFAEGKGFFLVAVLNLAMFFFATQMRSWLETLTSTSGGGSMGYGTIAATKAITKLVTKTVAGAASVAGGAARGAARGGQRAVSAANRATQGPEWASQRQRQAALAARSRAHQRQAPPLMDHHPRPQPGGPGNRGPGGQPGHTGPGGPGGQGRRRRSPARQQAMPPLRRTGPPTPPVSPTGVPNGRPVRQAPPLSRQGPPTPPGRR